MHNELIKAIREIIDIPIFVPELKKESNYEFIFARIDNLEKQMGEWEAKSAMEPVVIPGEVSEAGSGWRREWPDTAGLWWFYGKLWAKDNDAKNKYESIEVRRIANGFAVIAKGAFLYESENHDGWWIKANLPVPPEV